MWKYKTSVIVAVATLAFGILGILFTIAQIWFVGARLPYRNLINETLYGLCFYSMIFALNKHSEKRWHSVPFVVIIVIHSFTLMTDLIKIRPDFQDYHSLDVFNRYLSYATLINFVALLISVFRVKNPVIKQYFRIYGFSWITNFVLFVAWSMVYALIYSKYIFTNYTWLKEVFILLPVAAILWMQYNLYIKYEFFKHGDAVIIKKAVENIASGSIGVVIHNHADGNYCEVEFVDEQGNLLNMLLLNTSDIAHAEEQDLTTRIANFGLNSSGTSL